MTFPEDVILGEHLDPDDRDPEAPVADAIEQATSAEPGYAAPTASGDLEAPEWDAQEQSRIVEFDDDYR